MKRTLLALSLAATPAVAQARDFCPERPGLNTPACIVDRGRVSVETAFADWTLERRGRDRTDTVLLADTLVRVGVADRVEARIGWTPLGRQDARGAGARTRVGDVTVGLKASLAHPDGEGLSVALLPYVSLPVGRVPIGAGTWGAGLLVPATYSLTNRVQLEATGEIDAAPDGDGGGRHLAYSGTGGIGIDLTDALTLTAEGQVEREQDPGGHEMHALAALSLAVKAGPDLQLDVLAAAGLNRASPDLELSGGVAVRF